MNDVASVGLDPLTRRWRATLSPKGARVVICMMIDAVAP